MKTLLLIFCLVLGTQGFTQYIGDNIINPFPICSGMYSLNDVSIPVQNNPNPPTAYDIGPGNDFGCFNGDTSSLEKPFWAYFKTNQIGQIDLNLFPVTSGHNHIVYGPFNSYGDMINSNGILGSTVAPIVSCFDNSWNNNSGGDNLSISPTLTDQYYLVLITNYTNFNQILLSNNITTSTGTLDSTICNDVQHISGHFFYDINSDGIKDSTEYGINSPSILSHSISPTSANNFINPTGGDPNFYYSNSTSLATIYTVSSSATSVFSFSTPNSYSFTLDTLNNTIDTIKFGVYPNTIAPSFSNMIVSPFDSINCIYGQIIYNEIINTGTQNFVNNSIKIEVDNNSTISTFNNDGLIISPDSVINSNYYYSFNNLDVFQSAISYFKLQPNTTVTFGDTLSSIITTTCIDDLGTVLTQIDTAIRIVSCSYDPNNKLSFHDNGNIEEDISLGEELEYVINFQNTGNAAAVNIKIQDTIANNIDLHSFQFINSSHLSSYFIDASNRLITFYFNYINLPDSSSDEAGSHGFVKFKINALDNLDPRTEITNSASIYFDFNAPIYTNTALNKIECYFYPDSLIFSDNNIIYVGDNGNSTFQWFLDGNILNDATSSGIFVYENGVYSVESTNEFGCMSFGDFIVDYVNLVYKKDNTIKVYPIPTVNLINIISTNQNIKTVQVTDIIGNSIMIHNNINQKETKVIISDLASGVYFIKVIDYSGQETVKKIIKK